MLPWRNSFFQLGCFGALFSAGVLVMDFQQHSGPSSPAPSETPSPTATDSRYPGSGTAWENSLGMQFKPAGSPGILFSVWETRVEDFQQFADAVGYDATAGVMAEDGTGWHVSHDSWRNPGFAQTQDGPVVAVSWIDAHLFCDWLTKKERAANLIGAAQYYRLPTDAEWNTAIGSSTYPWGEDWPPPATAGNYMRSGESPTYARSQIPGSDRFQFTAPVGSFTANGYGLYDLGGNVWQWTEDWYRREMSTARVRNVAHALNDDGGGRKYRTARCASFLDSFPLALETASHDRDLPSLRQINFGFRCVLVTGP